MGSLLAEDNKKAKANQNISWLKKICFYGFGGVGFLFKAFKHAYSKHFLSYLRHTHSCWMLGKK
ncbi:hypothetical protein DDP57_02385 [Helicobacter pylori]|nr:hypothetical protein [Helicobacter pylori]RKV02336.1 hypothetical protein DDP57_02385 [Helicobacter pylori]